MEIKWRKDLETGIEIIDNQHRELFRRINDLLEACREGRGKSRAAETVGFLEDYVEEHFTSEERYMKRYGYPAYDSHVSKHNEFKDDLGRLAGALKEKGPTVDFVVKINRTVVDWLIDHIGKVDRSFANYIDNR